MGDKEKIIANVSFQYDSVINWTPVSFSLVFVTKMRKIKHISQIPSIRTTLAIPKFLTARYFRLNSLTPQDYIDAAVYTTPYEDQTIAETIAYEILFPKIKTVQKQQKQPHTKSIPSSKQSVKIDPSQMILDDLSSLDIDIDALSELSDIDSLIEEETEFPAFTLFEKLLTSQDPSEQSMAELISMFGGPSQLEALGVSTLDIVKEFLQEMLRGQINDLTPEQLLHSGKSGFSKNLLPEITQPWELASGLAGSGKIQELKDHLEDILDNGSTREIGKTLKYLQPYLPDEQVPFDPKIFKEFEKAGIKRSQNLTEFTELLDGLSQWIQPTDDLLKKSAQENITRALQSANWIEQTFGHELQEQLFNHWADGLKTPPTLDELMNNAVDCHRWQEMIKTSFNDHLSDLKQSIAQKSQSKQGLPDEILNSANTTQKLMDLETKITNKLASQLTNEMMSGIPNKDQFLPMLDQFLDSGVKVLDVKSLVRSGSQLGVNPQEIYDRLGDPVKQLTDMINNNIQDASRYQKLVQQISKGRGRTIDPNLVQSLAQQAFQHGNNEGMAALLAINLAKASSAVPEDFAVQSINYKGIGSGDNLLKEWFTGRHSIKGKLRQRIKEIAKDALLQLAMDWINKGTGSVDKGLIPQNRSRPFLSGDDLDLLDIEATLDSIVNAGKSLEMITTDDLFVYDTGKGQAAMGVLIDISGSMSGKDLAICAIAVVMLLGKLKAKEISIALFESDTHVIKGFDQERDLDEVADELLDLSARGGTCVDAALRWMTDQFEQVFQSEFKMLFLLSDYCFSENTSQVRKLGEKLADLKVQYLGASHGHVCNAANEVLAETMGGHSIKLSSVERIPEILTQAIDQFNSSGFSYSS